MKTQSVLSAMEEMYRSFPIGIDPNKLRYSIAPNVYEGALKELEKENGVPLKFRGIEVIPNKDQQSGTMNLGAKV